MSDAIHGIGTLLKLGDGGSPETFSTISEVTELSGPSLEKETVEVTSHDTKANASSYKEYIEGVKDGGEVSLTLNFIPTDSTHGPTNGLLAEYESGGTTNYKIVFPDSGSTTWTIPAICTGFEPEEPIDGQLTADVTLKVDGKPTLN